MNRVIRHPAFFGSVAVAVLGIISSDSALLPGILFWAEALPHFLRELHPAAAAFAMAFSSVTVVLNSLRLSRKKLDVHPA